MLFKLLFKIFFNVQILKAQKYRPQTKSILLFNLQLFKIQQFRPQAQIQSNKDYSWLLIPLNTIIDFSIASITAFFPTDKAYTNLTGRSPVQSSRGNNYVLVCYSYDTNAILTKKLKNRSASKIVHAWMKLNNQLELVGVQPKIYILDNECSNDFKQALHNKPPFFSINTFANASTQCSWMIHSNIQK